METLKLINENEVEMKSSKGFFIGCIDSVLMENDYKFIEDNLGYENDKYYSVSLEDKEVVVIDTLPSYEVQCKGDINGYFIPSGMSALSIVPLELCNTYLLEVSKEEGLLIENKCIRVKYSNGCLSLKYNDKEVVMYIDNDSPPLGLDRL